MKRFAITGVAGYIAPRHMQAIKDTNNNLIAGLDKFDSVGIIDSFFPKANFFTEPERFDRHLDKLRRENNGENKVDFVSVCTPNYLHDSHIRMALRNDADAICEKPLVLNPWNIDALIEVEKRNGRKINNILQLRMHPSIIALKKRIDEGPKDKIYDVDLTYLTSRGKWYFVSWKGDVEKSGGVSTNIGVHFFDMLTHIFGSVKKNIVHKLDADCNAGYLELERARVRWFLSVDYNNIPDEIKATGARTYRSITVNGEEIEFSGGFTDLHTLSYKAILAGNGFGIEETRNSIQTVYDIRHSEVSALKGDYHPFLKKKIEFHPFLKRQILH